jgi:hypothetical protein
MIFYTCQQGNNTEPISTGNGRKQLSVEFLFTKSGRGPTSRRTKAFLPDTGAYSSAVRNGLFYQEILHLGKKAQVVRHPLTIHPEPFRKEARSPMVML